MELVSSEIALVTAGLVGLGITTIAILRDLSASRPLVTPSSITPTLPSADGATT